MKKIFYSICLVALAASCTKNDVSYNVAEQISLAPLAQTSTRAALAQGAVPTENLIVSANAVCQVLLLLPVRSFTSTKWNS